MNVFVVLAGDFIMGVYSDKVLAIRRLRLAWDAEAYTFDQVYETSDEVKFCIRRRARIGENPNDTLIVSTVRVVTNRLIEG